MKILTHNLGFPRIGANRELKKTLELFWAGKTTEAELLAAAKRIREQNWRTQKEGGLDLIPSNDFSLYDHVLDTCELVGAIPERFHWNGDKVPRSTYFALARGSTDESAPCPGCGKTHATAALEMTKWFDTNYHYLVPELRAGQKFQLSSSKPFDEFSEARSLGIATKPVLLGPISFLLLSKLPGSKGPENHRWELLGPLVSVYAQVLQRLEALGATWVQIDEPALVLDLSLDQRRAFATAFGELRKCAPKLRLLLATYFGELRDNAELAAQLPIDALHVDAVRTPNQLESVALLLPPQVMLSVGIVDGRNIWKTDFQRALSLLRRTRKVVGAERLMLAPSCSLLHCPVTLESEIKLNSKIKEWLAFGREKLTEVVQLAGLLDGASPRSVLETNQRASAARRKSRLTHNSKVKRRMASVANESLRRVSPFPIRHELQKEHLKLPLLPTTTIGSFPQTRQVRSMRARFRRAEINVADYERFLERETRKAIRLQHRLGLDVLVHGEFERNDMVEYFGEQLAGFTFTENGWVQSYGSRCVKPPIIFGDVYRRKPMTVRWSAFAQALTKKPMKGMLTGPITILQWSFVRDDQPRSETARQIALAIRDEVTDLEAAGLRIIQIDEPALREGLPLRFDERSYYLRWAVEAFRLASSGVKDQTQIHTHMCYCDFNDIIDSIAKLDADVISIEASRSKMELLDAFTNYKYRNQIGPGVWDIHSPRVPAAEEMVELIRRAADVLPIEHLWVNPDCGLKTRQWEEVTAALEKMVAAARIARKEFQTRGVSPASKTNRSQSIKS
jgi:5-methyltetrahydropteroyltriglutamate--homocysteine methyltransferase